MSNRQRGISLIVVLIGLVIISFAAVALLRSTDTATLIAGNLGFKKAALPSGDAGTEVAVVWLNTAHADITRPLFSDQAASGYYATSADACDLTGTRTPDDQADDVQWGAADPGNTCHMVGAVVGAGNGVADGYNVRYVVNRMCNVEGNPLSPLAADGVTPRICARAETTSGESSTKVGPSYGQLPLTGSSRIYYRITSRIAGPRDTVRFVQAFVVL